MGRRMLCARLMALALGVLVMTAAAVMAHPVTLRIAAAPDAARIGGPLVIELALHNGAEGSFPAPAPMDKGQFRLRLRAEDGRIYEISAAQFARETSGASAPPQRIVPLKGGETARYRMDAAQWLLAQPAPGRYALTAHFHAQGVGFDSPPTQITLTAAPVIAAAWFRDGAEDAALGLAADPGGAALAILRAPEGRPDLFSARPLAGEVAADRLSLPVQLDLAPTLALALSGAMAQALRLDGSGAGAPLDTGLRDPVALGGLEQDGAAVWILADRAAPGALIRLQAGADGALIATPLPAADAPAAVSVLVDQGRGTLMLIHAAAGGAAIRTPEGARARALPLPAGRILSLGAPRMAPHDRAFVDAAIAVDGGAVVLARAPLTGDAPGPSAALPRMRAQIEHWIWPDFPTPDPQVLAIARGFGALIGLRGGQVHIGRRLRQIAPDADRMALLALPGRGLWWAQASRDEGMRVERADLP